MLSLLRYKTIHKDNTNEWVVLLHGMGGSSAIWFKQLRDYKEHFNVLLIDLPGHGGSEIGLKDMKEKTIQFVAKKVLKVLDRLNIQKAHFIGISLGTIIIQGINQLAPNRVKSMVLGGAVETFNLLIRTALRILEPIKSCFSYMFLYKMCAWILMPKKNHRESRQAFVKEAYKLGKKEFLNWFSIFKQIHPFFKNQDSSKQKTPTLYIMGDQDYMFLPTIEKNIQNLKNAFLQVINSGHVVNIERPKEFNRLSIQFILSLSNPSKSNA